MGLIKQNRLQHLAISLLFVLVIVSPHLNSLNRIAEGRALLETLRHSKTVAEEKVAFLSSQIGSMPPRCERSCGSCKHCEPIEVPTNPQIKAAGGSNSSSSSSVSSIGDHGSNYKPMSWKCKCGNLIFNP